MKLFGTVRKKITKFICLSDTMVLDNEIYKIHFDSQKISQLQTLPNLTSQILLGHFFTGDSNTFLAVH